eukprot:5987-Heterococcus_DN1.PRE.1
MQAVLQQAEPSNTSRAAVVQSPWALRKRISACHDAGASDVALLLTAFSSDAYHNASRCALLFRLAPYVCSSRCLLYAHAVVRADAMLSSSSLTHAQ